MKKVTFGKMRPVSEYRQDGTWSEVFADGESVGEIVKEMSADIMSSRLVAKSYEVRLFEEGSQDKCFDVDGVVTSGWLYSSTSKSEYKTARAALKAAKDYVRDFYNK